MHRPFKPLTIKPQSVNQVSDDAIPRPRKKRRISEDEDTAAIKAAIPIATGNQPEPKPFQNPRKPLLVVNRNLIETNAKETAEKVASQPEGYYTVLWRKFSTKKNVTWDGDGILAVRGGYAFLTDISGRDMGKTVCKEPLLPESEISLGGKVVQVESVISKKDYLAGKPFLGTATQVIEVAKATPKCDETPTRHGASKQAELSLKKRNRQNKLDEIQSKTPRQAPSAAQTAATKTKFRAPTMVSGAQYSSKPVGEDPKPKHDPNAENALVMKRPKFAPKGKRIVDVVMDPILTKHLREHQRTGVSFLYECIMGMRDYQGEGAILADEMGLGKTLQTIALLWVLLKQNPIYDDPGIVRKALIVCPVTLINNWRKEFWKWLGKERIGVFVLDDNKFAKITDFTKGRMYQVMIIGYERLRQVKDDLAQADIDLVICDEGHRLKTDKNQSAKAIKELSTERRIVLTGTPMQNNFSEYFTMIDFVNPGLLGKYSVFKSQFETPINKGRQPNAHSKDVEKGEARSEELADLTSKFILRRTVDILAKYLPSKTEYIVFVKPTESQAKVYRAAVGSSELGSVIKSPQASLQLIQMLTKICNSPRLVTAKNSEGIESLSDEKVKGIAESIASRSINTNTKGDSGKLLVLDALLSQIRNTCPDEKVVIVSNFTSTLDLIQGRLGQYGTLRLDGKTPAKDRNGLVERFNRTSATNFFAFLLSAKAGGVGLNLIGANRLILFDCDWNPATDLQAMGRIHRDGQKRPCYIYRFLVMGAMDEKIFQRQVSKRGLADSVVDSKANASSFTQDELRDLFTFDESGRCMTHELLGCPCEGSGVVEPEGLLTTNADDQNDEVSNVEADSDDELPEIGAFVKASSYNADETERRIRAEQTGRGGEISGGQKGKMKGLMEYQHIDPAEFVDANVEETTDLDTRQQIDSVLYDDALSKCLYSNGDGSRIAYLFARIAS